MKSIVITPKTKKELEFVTELLKKLDIPTKVLSQEEKLDALFLMMMQEADKADTVSKDEVLRKLRS